MTQNVKLGAAIRCAAHCVRKKDTEYHGDMKAMSRTSIREYILRQQEGYLGEHPARDRPSEILEKVLGTDFRKIFRPNSQFA